MSTSSTSSNPTTPSHVKLLCSLGGRILPRPADGVLRHAGGDTRIVTVPRSVTLSSFFSRLSDAFSHASAFAVRYQLPGEPLDAGLITVSTADDLENMFDELEKLPADSKLRLFLFPLSESSAGLSPHFDAPEVEYIEAVNGIVRRSDSCASLASGPAVQAASFSPPMLSPMSSDASHAALAPLVDLESSPQQLHSHLLTETETAMEHISISPNVSGSDVEVGMEDRKGNEEVKEIRYKQPLSQLPPLPPMFMNMEDHSPVGEPVVVGNNYCNMCVKELPHAHSDPVVTEYVHDGPGGPVVPEPSQPVFLSLRPGDMERIMAQERTLAAQMGAFGGNHVPAMAYGLEGSVSSGNVYPVFVGHLNPLQQEYLQQQHHLQQQQKQHLPMAYGVTPYAVRQDVGGNTFFVDSNVRANTKFHEESPQHRGNLQPVYVPTYVNQADLTMEPLWSSPTDIPSIGEFGRQASAPEVSSRNIIAEQSQKKPDNSFAAAQDVKLKGTLQMGNFIDMMEQKPVVATEALPSTTVDTVPSIPTASQYVQTRTPINVHGMTGIVGPNGVYPSYVGATLGGHAMPQSYYGVNQVYASTMMNPQSNKKDVPLVHQPKEIHSEVAAAASVDPILPSSNAPHSVFTEQAQQPSVSDTPQPTILPMPQFSHEDPWIILESTVALPPKPKKVAGSSPREVSAANGPLNSRVPDINIPLDETEPDVLDRELTDQTYTVKGAEAASDPSLVEEEILVTPAHRATEKSDSVEQETEESSAILDEGGPVSNKQDGENHGHDVSKSRPADWIGTGFSVTDDNRHLQIIKNSDLEELHELGSGTFGTVFHGKWRGTDVAIKRINERCFAGKQSEQERMRSDFWNEASKLSELHHPNVVAFYGIVLDGPGGSIATVTEYMVNGSLRTALLKNSKSLDRRKRLILATDAAFGMEYLHSKNIVHFDLKSDNLLVNLRDSQRPICKVADLGLSKVKCQTLISGGVRGTLPWMAPELLSGSSSLVSEKVDVFSFGIVLWELLTGEEPYADLHYGVIIGGIVSNTLRPTVPESCDPDWRSLMEHCWANEPSDRPTFTEIASRLRVMASSPHKALA